MLKLSTEQNASLPEPSMSDKEMKTANDLHSLSSPSTVCPLGTISGTWTSTSNPMSPWHKVSYQRNSSSKDVAGGDGFLPNNKIECSTQDDRLGEARLGIHRNYQTESERLQTMRLGV